MGTSVVAGFHEMKHAIRNKYIFKKNEQFPCILDDHKPNQRTLKQHLQSIKHLDSANCNCKPVVCRLYVQRCHVHKQATYGHFQQYGVALLNHQSFFKKKYSYDFSNNCNVKPVVCRLYVQRCHVHKQATYGHFQQNGVALLNHWCRHIYQIEKYKCI